jgi:nucleoid DNA-binding protein
MDVVHKGTGQGGLMNREELIEKVSKRVQIPSNVARVIVNTIFD